LANPPGVVARCCSVWFRAFVSFTYFGLTLESGVALIKHQASALQALAALPSKARRGVTPEAKPQ